MVVYLALESVSEPWRDKNVADQIILTKNYTTIGNVDNNDIHLPLEDMQGCLSISKAEDGRFYVASHQIPVFLNDQAVIQPCRLSHKDRIRVGNEKFGCVFCFVQINPLISPRMGGIGEETAVRLRPLHSPIQQKTTQKILAIAKDHEEEKRTTQKISLQSSSSSETVKINKAGLSPLTPPTGNLMSQTSPSSSLNETVRIAKKSTPPPNTIQDKVQAHPSKTPIELSTASTNPEKTEKIMRMSRDVISTPKTPVSQVSSPVPAKPSPSPNILESPGEMEMTLLWDSRTESEKLVPQLVSPSNGQVVEITKDNFIIGRSSSSDLCLRDDYISRQQLQLSKIPIGFLAKNIGKNDVLIEKKTVQAANADGRSILEEKVLRPGDAIVLAQEAVIVLGNQVVYFYNIPEPQGNATETSLRDRKYKFYQNLSSQKAELLDAAQLQKWLTPPRAIFDGLHIGIWFRYLAINDLSGDFFLYHKTKDVLYVCLGDVSGHGATAALLASQISGMFKILAEQSHSAEEIVLAMNQHLLSLKQQKSHQTLYALINVLQISENGVEVCVAGNSVPPLRYISKEKKLMSLDTPATPIGLFEGEKFKVFWEAIDFKENDMLLMFTDGVTEAEMGDDTLLEYHRVRRQIELQIQQNQNWEDFLDNFLVWLKQQSEIRDDLSIVLIGKMP